MLGARTTKSFNAEELFTMSNTENLIPGHVCWDSELDFRKKFLRTLFEEHCDYWEFKLQEFDNDKFWKQFFVNRLDCR